MSAERCLGDGLKLPTKNGEPVIRITREGKKRKRKERKERKGKESKEKGRKTQKRTWRVRNDHVLFILFFIYLYTVKNIRSQYTKSYNKHHLLTESEVITGKSQTEALMY